MRSNCVLQPRLGKLVLTVLADDPLAFNVRSEALWVLGIILAIRPHPLDQEGFVRIADRVWLERTGDEDISRRVHFQFAFDPFDGVETGTLKTLTIRVPEKGDLAADGELLTTDQEDLFWWAMWLANFRCSLTTE